MLKVEEYFRRPFVVDAVRVTRENMDEVAGWCGGEIKQSLSDSRTGATRRMPVPYVKVPVQHVKRESASMGLVGCWVVKMGESFRVYNSKVFMDTFAPASHSFVDMAEEFYNKQLGAAIG